jgi:cobalt-zinc-cadmium efflux system outer membrane protein
MKYLILLTILIVHLTVHSQSNFDELIKTVESNNKELETLRKTTEARTLMYKTGLTLQNPQVSFDYMIGSPVTAGNQTDVLISQSFDFPTVYAKRKQLANEKIMQIEFDYQLQRQDILLKAKQLIIDQIYRNKLAIEYQQRLKTNELLVQSFETKIANGDATIIELNKAKLQLIELKKLNSLNASQIAENNSLLSGLNGGNSVAYTDTLYPVLTIPTSFEEYISTINSRDPYLQNLEQENAIAMKQLELSKSLALPKFELGYHYQGILGQRFNGAHLGVTIPLWEHKNTIKFANAALAVNSIEQVQYTNDRYFELQSKYNQFGAQSTALAEYQEVFTDNYSAAILLKGLNYGEISTIEYYNELNYYNSNYDLYLATEKEKYLLLIDLLKY